MTNPRCSHGFCAVGSNLFAISGKIDDISLTPSCEKYDILLDKWEHIADTEYECARPCLIPYNNKKIFKFGGSN